MTNNQTARREEPVLALGYALGLQRRNIPARVMDLPEKYLTETFGYNKTKYLRADVDGALASGMTAAEFSACVENAAAFHAYPAPIPSKVRGWWYAARSRALDDPEMAKQLLGKCTDTQRRSAMQILARRVRNSAFDAKNKEYNADVLEDGAQKLKALFKPLLPGLRIDQVRKLLHPARPDAGGDGQFHTLAEHDLLEQPGVVFRRRKGVSGEGILELVANFQVIEIRSGTARFADGQSSPLHRMSVLARHDKEPREIEVLGSIYDPEAVMQAGNGELVITSALNWRSYLSFKVAVEGAQHRDTSVDRVFVVGSFVNAAGQLVPNDGVAFLHEREECPYHNHRFADQGDAGVFRLLSNLFCDLSVAVILVFGLGVFLKPLLGPAYPHLLVLGAFTAGKSTLCALFLRFLGWRSVSGPEEFCTRYRTKKAVANSLLPMQVEEVGRVRGEARQNLVDVLNQAYNVAPSSHGHLDKRFCLMAPAIMYGQDFSAEDVALRTKTVLVPLDGTKKDPAALQQCIAAPAVWPMRAWANHVCAWANGRDVAALVNEKKLFLEGQLQNASAAQVGGLGRLVWNYAVLLVVADALNAFGVSVDITDYVVGLVRHHIAELSGGTEEDDRSTVGLQFLSDLVSHYQAYGIQRGLIGEWQADGLYVHLRTALNVLHREGHRYDVSAPTTVRRMLMDEQLGQPKKHRVQNVERRCFFFPDAKLRELGYAYDAPPGDDRL